MKIKSLIEVLLILLSGLTIFSQSRNVAVKFDEFSNYPAEKVSPLYDRTQRFAKRLKIEPSSKKAVMIFYNQRKGKFPLEGGKDWANSAENYLKNFFETNEQSIVLINGGYREYPTLEFWIVPEGAEMPKPTPDFTKNEIVYCPEIRVAGDGFRRARTEPLKFSVAINGALPNESFPLEWNVSAGKIISGQGTNQIQIDLSGTDAKKISAAVIVGNLPPECDAHAYNSTEIGFYPYILDEFSHVPYSEIAARIQNLFVELGNDPSMSGYIAVYGSRQGNKKDTAWAIRNIQQSISFMKLDPSRIKIADGGFREEMWVEVYLLPPGVEPPKPTPTLNSDFVVEPKRKVTRRRKSSR